MCVVKTGKHCEVEQVPCASHPCEKGGVCRPSPDYTSYTCRCPAGWQGTSVCTWDCVSSSVCGDTKCNFCMQNCSKYDLNCCHIYCFYFAILVAGVTIKKYLSVLLGGCCNCMSLFWLIQDHAAVRMLMNAKRIHAKMVATAWTAQGVTRANVSLATVDITVRLTSTTVLQVSFTTANLVTLIVNTQCFPESQEWHIYPLN